MITEPWLAPVCPEAIELMMYFNPDSAWMLDITYKDERDKRTKKLYTHIGGIDDKVMPWCVLPPFANVLTKEEFIDLIYKPFIYSLDIP